MSQQHTPQHTKPCRECSFRRDITPGFLGGSPASTYIGQTQAGFMIPCHLCCDFSNPDWKDKAFETPQCAGAAVYRANLGIKSGNGVLEVEADTETVFASHAEFLSHHTGLDVALCQELLERRVTPDDMAAYELQRAGVKFVQLPVQIPIKEKL